MRLLKKLFQGKDREIHSHADFWAWFQENEKDFHKVVKGNRKIEKNFFNQLSPKLNQLREGFFYLTGMIDEATVELVLTADGAIRNFVFVEELVQAAPALAGWKFTALKPAIDIKDFSIQMGGWEFRENNISFVANDHPEYPDEIDLTIIHPDLNDNNRDAIIQGLYIFLDNYLGELEFATSIDNISFAGKHDVQQELIPIQKLKDYLNWRKKEEVEKYEGTRYDTEHDNNSILEATLENGKPLIAVINTELLEWDRKASHPWIAKIELKYDGKQNNGLPDQETLRLLEGIEDELLKVLKDFEGHLNVGRDTADNTRTIYFACKDFRKPAKVLSDIQLKYSASTDIAFDIYKDKYWQSFNHFRNT